MESDKRKDMSLVFLIGMPGAGKTFWANQLSAAYGTPLIDMDEQLEQLEGDTISGIFEKLGEEGFRQKEKELLVSIIDNGATAIVACGGGTPCYFDNIQRMLHSGTVVYLRGQTHTLGDHLRHEAHKRPLLAAHQDLEAYLGHVLQERTMIYEKAHHILDVENISIATFAKILPHVQTGT